MSLIVVYTIITTSVIGLTSGVILYFVAQKFMVYEDPRVDQVTEALPGANCGGCGFAGCRNFAENCVKTDDLDKLFCPVGGNDCMKNVATILGKLSGERAPKVAVVRCAGSCEHRPKTNTYDGTTTCSIAAALYGGETGCQYGCLGFGDCVTVCKFDAIHMDEKTGLPVVIDSKCTACGACVTACPKNIIELRKKHKKDFKIFVSCVNKDRGGPARKSCAVACIGCGKCVEVCEYNAITLENYLAFIDSDKCKLCRKCMPVCPTNSIWEVNFPVKKTDKEPVQKETIKKQPENSGSDNQPKESPNA